MQNPSLRGAPFDVVSYRPRHAAAAGVETLTLAELRQRGTPGHLAAPQRLEFVLMMLYTRGTGEHVVDFITHKVRPRTLIVVPAGSVHQFRLQPSMDARLLVAEPGRMLPARLSACWLDTARWPACTLLQSDDASAFIDTCDALARDLLRDAPLPLLQALARERLLTCLLLLQIGWQRDAQRDGSVAQHSDLTIEFRKLIEQHYADRWPAARYARKLGYAEKTLARACIASNGLTPKAWIDARVLLEAKRLLAHGGDSVQTIALRLGFESSSQLVRFFRRLEGTTPMAFKSTLPT